MGRRNCPVPGTTLSLLIELPVRRPRNASYQRQHLPRSRHLGHAAWLTTPARAHILFLGVVLRNDTGPSTTTLRRRTSTSVTTWWATSCSIRRTYPDPRGTCSTPPRPRKIPADAGVQPHHDRRPSRPLDRPAARSTSVGSVLRRHDDHMFAPPRPRHVPARYGDPGAPLSIPAPARPWVTTMARRDVATCQRLAAQLRSPRGTSTPAAAPFLIDVAGLQSSPSSRPSAGPAAVVAHRRQQDAPAQHGRMSASTWSKTTEPRRWKRHHQQLVRPCRRQQPLGGADRRAEPQQRSSTSAAPPVDQPDSARAALDR